MQPALLNDLDCSKRLRKLLTLYLFSLSELHYFCTNLKLNFQLMIFLKFATDFSSPEPKAPGELIV